MSDAQKPLFIFEMANNHQGVVEHGMSIINAMRDVAAPFRDRFRFAVKFQYRDLDTFIHPAARGRADIKNVKRFEDTRLSRHEFAQLLDCVRTAGFLAVCTPFDEASVGAIFQQGYDYIKIASCSFGDWQLMEEIATAALPVIASTAGAALDTIRRTVSFFQNRNIGITLLHCIGEYPTERTSLQLNQIDYLRKVFPEIPIGFSSHEVPDDTLPVIMAVAKGAHVFERHVGMATAEFSLNAYSSNPDQVTAWLTAAAAAFDMGGTENKRYMPSEKEMDDLAALRRGAFLVDAIHKGTSLSTKNVYFAFPCRPGQLVASDFSKYNQLTLLKDLEKDSPVMCDEVKSYDTTPLVRAYTNKVKELIDASNAVVPIGSMCELSHHVGIENFERYGLALISCVNREYCKKLLVLLPGQENPMHSHAIKEETFLVLHGELVVCGADGQKRRIGKGETYTVERNAFHSLLSPHGCVVEELSTTHYPDDSYYVDGEKFIYPRKTIVNLTREALAAR